MRSGLTANINGGSEGIALKEIRAEWVDPQHRKITRPWPFLDPFGYADSRRIQGRAEIEDALARILSYRDSRIIVVHGPSGSGKSSVINALAIPLLIGLGFSVAVEDCLKNPRVDPLLQLSRWQEFAHDKGTESAIVIDQLEELYTLLNETMRLEFISNVIDISSASRIILGVRREYYSDLDGDLSRLGVSLARIHVPLLTREAAGAAILAPARNAGIAFEDGLVRRIITDLELTDTSLTLSSTGQGHIDPPQLQIVMATLYDGIISDASHPSTITYSLYEGFGCAEGIIQNFLSSFLRTLGARPRAVAQSILKRMVTQEGTKKPLLQSDIQDLHRAVEADSVDSVLHELVSERILRTLDAEPGDSPDYELGHDYLASVIASWISSEEQPLRLLSDTLERQYPVLSAHPNRAPFDRAELDTSLQILRSESRKIPDWHTIFSTRAFLVLLAASLYWGRDSETNWLLRVFAPTGAAGVSAHAAELISSLTSSQAVIEDYGPADWLDQRDVERCIRSAIQAGSAATGYWAITRRARTVFRSVVLELSEDFPSTRTATRAVCLLPRYQTHSLWPDSTEIPISHQGTAVDALRVILLDPSSKVHTARNLLHSLQRRGVLIAPGSFIYQKDRYSTIDQSYRLGIVPVTVGEYKIFIDSGGYRDPKLVDKYWSTDGQLWLRSSSESSPDPRYWLNRDFGHPDQPVVGVNYFEAEAYCRFVEGRLPTEFEWERAARGLDGRMYPWGEDLEATRCKLEPDGSAPVPPFVGSYPAGASPDGLLDMSGNVWEWTSSDSESPGSKILRGGSMQLNQGVGRTVSRSHREPHDRYYFRGFRVCWEN